MKDELIGMAREALSIASDYQFRLNDRANTSNDAFEIYTFEQVWGSAALGFGGIGGQAMTTARTYVLVPQVDGEDCIVYFGGRFAYKAPPSSEFMEDVRCCRLEPVSRKGKYFKGVDDGTK